MSFGFQRQQRTFVNDTTTLTAYLYDDDNESLVPESNISDVTFTVVPPLVLPSTVTPVAGSVTGDGTGVYVVPSTVNTKVGEYHGIAVFTFTDANGQHTKTIPVDYDCVDPFEVALVPITTAQPAIDLAWMKIEDCFDSEMGGPWLRDQTLARFDKDKIQKLLPDVFFEINAQQPQTNYTSEGFAYGSNDGTALVAQGLLVATIKHLMRSYTEQPDVIGAQVNFFDRKRYLDAWNTSYQIEFPRWQAWLFQFKLRSYNASDTQLLVAQKAGRLLPAPLRQRGVGRGYY